MNQLPVFLLGCFLYHHRSMSRAQGFALASVLLGWIVGAGVIWQLNTHDVRAFGFLVVIVLLYGFVYLAQLFNFRNAVLNAIGRQSYAIYLVHILVLHVMQILLPGTGFLRLAVGISLVVPISYAVAVLLHKVIEKPAQRLTARLTAPKPNPTLRMNH